ncbi:acyl-CoA dehydrogenase family protein [Paenochrobactrum pullorum]|uniref:acyl-CoA dehydrogenase family protein n=1 Tax=Paenochrobactrum pullorum TaxID=1324351 RepID=UPI0035BC1C97
MQELDFAFAPVSKSILAERWEKLQEETMRFCVTHVRNQLLEIRTNSSIPSVLLEKLKLTGWFGLLIPKHYGGLGGDCLARVINVEHVTRECPDLGAILQIAQLGTGSILEFGSEKQKQKWLPAMVWGDRICTIAITEEHSGSHVNGMNTFYKETAGGYILNGSKCFIGNCSIANLHVVYARKKGTDRLSAFIVEGERAGVDNTEAHNHQGLKAFPFGRLHLRNVFVPRENILGPKGDGLRLAYYVIGHHGRPSLTALALGIHLRILDIAFSFARGRKLYGKPISELPDVRNKIFDVYMRYEQSRQVAYDAAHRMSIGQNSAYRHLAMAKFLSGDHVCHSANIAAEIFGARVGLPEFEIAQLTLDAMMTRPPSGTGDVQKMRIMDDFFNMSGRDPKTSA